MRARIGLPFLALAGMILLVGLACVTSAGVPPTSAPPTGVPVEPATQAPIDIAPTQAPTEPPAEPTSGASQYFTEEFLQDLGSNWTQLLKGGGALKADQVTTSFNDGKMHMEINTNDMYVYYFYTPYTYTDVRLDLRVDNIGVNSQNIRLVCRSSGDQWYEFSVGSDGMWYLYAYKKSNARSYNVLASAGAATLKQGHATNEYGMSCVGDKIHLFVNGMELPYSPVKMLSYFFLDGQVGFNVSSITSTPVIVDLDWFKISQP